jgi:two-component system, cell cycle sensor histidine kinase and response regulator CckA
VGEHGAEREIRQFERIIFDATPALIFVKDCHNRVLRCNAPAAAALGYSVEALEGSLVRDFHPDEADQYYRDDLEVIATGRPKLGIIEQLQVASGDKRWIRTDKVPYRGDDGAIAGIIVFSVDITEVKQLEERIQRAQRLESLGVMAGGIAHDFNNLLMGVLGHASLAALELPPGSPARERIAQIQIAAQRAAELTQQMLAYSGRGRFVVQALDLNELVEEMAHLLEVATSKRATLEYRFRPDLPPIEADATQVRQVIMNLLTNAGEALGGAGGRVTIATGTTRADAGTADLPPGLYVTCSIADTGCGMDEATLQKIFDPFFTTKFTGRGLGLAAVLGIMRGHQGAVRVVSEPGLGTTFTLLFPAASRPAESVAAAPAPAVAWRGEGTALVVDDDESCRSVARAMLEHAGLQVLTARDGGEALAVLRAHGPTISVVLLDLLMPGMDGETAYREMRRQEPGLRVVLMSGYNEQDVTSRFAGQDRVRFLQKPFRAADLWTLLQETLGT